jgi:hypothetical protein
MKNKLMILTMALVAVSNVMVANLNAVPVGKIASNIALFIAVPIVGGVMIASPILGGLYALDKFAPQQPVQPVQASKMQAAKNALNNAGTFVNNNKVATGAGLVAVAGVVYAYKQGFFGKAKAVGKDKK